jgi:hypothetical protein
LPGDRPADRDRRQDPPRSGSGPAARTLLLLGAGLGERLPLRGSVSCPVEEPLPGLPGRCRPWLDCCRPWRIAAQLPRTRPFPCFPRSSRRASPRSGGWSRFTAASDC